MSEERRESEEGGNERKKEGQWVRGEGGGREGRGWRELGRRNRRGRRKGGGEGGDQRYEDRRENFLHRYIAPLTRRHRYVEDTIPT